VCDYAGSYADLTPFVPYPGDVVNASLVVDNHLLSPEDLSVLFGRPFMGGLDRHGVLASSPTEAIEQQVLEILENAPDKFFLAADCTVPSETPWENLKVAIDTAHNYMR
jgi:uroporphyrinogen decarboxylase